MVRLDIQDHTYWDPEGRRVIGCTEALTLLGILNTEWYDDRGTERGSAVHAMTKQANLARRAGQGSPLFDAALKPWLDCYYQFLHDYDPEFLLVEQPLLHPTMRYAGTPDMCVVLRKSVPEPHGATIDMKTGAAEPWHPFQVSLYHELARASGVFAKASFVPTGSSGSRTAPSLARPQLYNLYLQPDVPSRPYRLIARTYEPLAIPMVAVAQWRLHHQLKGRR